MPLEEGAMARKTLQALFTAISYPTTPSSDRVEIAFEPELFHVTTRGKT